MRTMRLFCTVWTCIRVGEAGGMQGARTAGILQVGCSFPWLQNQQRRVKPVDTIRTGRTNKPFTAFQP